MSEENQELSQNGQWRERSEAETGIDGEFIELSLVLPFYNPGSALRPAVDQIISVLSARNISFELIAVCDGSTDDSARSLKGVPSPPLKLVEVDQNQGKGAALRRGFLLAKGEYLGFIDADGEIDPSSLTAFVDIMRIQSPDIVLGSKRHVGSQVEYPIVRRIYSWGYQQLVRVLFKLHVSDTQTGVKLARREVLDKVLPVMVETGYAFDLELFIVAARYGYGDFVEAPIILSRKFTSTISTRAVFAMLRDTLAIFVRLKRGYYGPKS